MTKRITIVIEDELDRKLRHIHAVEVEKRGKDKDTRSYSYSKAVNDTLRKQLDPNV